MTEVQNFMLVVCFGCTIGFLIGTFSIMVSDGIHYLKKRMRMKKDKIIPVSDINAAHFFKYCFLHNRFHLSYRSLSIDFFLTDRFGCCLPSC